MTNLAVPRVQDLVADCGHPHWPGWQLLAALLIGAQIAVLMAHEGFGLRWRPRLLRPAEIEGDANAVRLARRAA